MFKLFIRKYAIMMKQRILPPHDTRPSSRRTESLSIPQSSTLLYPTFDSSSSTSSTSFSSPLLSSQSSSPTIPSSSSPILPSALPSSPLEKNRLQSQNHERTVADPVPSGLETEGMVIGPSLRRNDERSEDDAPPAYEKCVDE